VKRVDSVAERKAPLNYEINILHIFSLYEIRGKVNAIFVHMKYDNKRCCTL